MFLIDQPIQILDIPNKNNRLYTTKVAEDIVEQAKKNNLVGTPGMIGMPNLNPGADIASFTMVPIEKVSHVVTDLKIKDNQIVGTVEINNAYPKAKELSDMLDNGIHMDFRMAGVCNLTPSDTQPGVVEVTNFTLISINAVNEGA